MTPPALDNDVDQRLERLQQTLADTISTVERQGRVFHGRLRQLEAGRAFRPAPRESVPVSLLPVVDPPMGPRRAAEPSSASGRIWPSDLIGDPKPPTPPRLPTPPRPPTPPTSRRSLGAGMSLSDFVGGRGLAWLGGIAILAGTVLFLALAISHGWIGREARVALAAVGSAVLVAAGTWLHARRGRTEAAVVMVGAGTAVLFATSVVAGEVYGLVSPLVAMAASMLAGAVATTLAIRWAGRAIGALGLVGALLSPVLAGAPSTAPTIAMLAVAGVSAMWIVVWQRWIWLALATVVISAPQWAAWMLQGHSGAADLLVLVAFAALGLAGAVGTQRRGDGKRPQVAAAALLILNACAVAAVGRIALTEAAGATVSALWLAGLGGAHVALGLCSHRRVAIARPIRQTSIAIGVVLADVAFGLSASGLMLVAGWSAAGVAFAWLVRRSDCDSTDAVLATLGVGAHLGLVLVRTIIEAPPSDLTGGSTELVQLTTVAILAASCFASAQLAGRGQGLLRAGLGMLGLGAIAYLTAGALDGVALIAAWAAEGIALDRIARRTGDQIAQLGSYGFLGGAAVYAIAAEAPPYGLITGVPNLGLAAIAMAIISATLLVLACAREAGSHERSLLLAASTATLLYLASIAIVTAFQPTDGTTLDTVLDLSVRQQGQVLLSSMWGLVGLTGLIVGLRRGSGPIRIGALSLLLLSVGKVFLYDLSTLTSIYRVISCIVLGLLLLAGAFAYQRMRPPPAPDLRTLHPSQR